MASSRPERVCISTTNGSIRASTSSVWWTTRSGPSAMIVRSSSVTIVAISTITSLVWSRPVISRSIHTSTTADTTGGTMTGMDRCRALRTAARRAGCDRAQRAAQPVRVHGLPRRGARAADRPHRPGRRRRGRRLAVRRRASATGPGPLPVDPTSAARSHRHCTRSSSMSTSSSPCTATGATGCSRRCSSGGATASSPTCSAPSSPRPCPTTRSSPTWRRSLASCAACIRTTRSTSRPTAACRSSCRRASAGSGPRWADWTGDGFVPPAAALVDALACVATVVVAAVRAAPLVLFGALAGVRRR